MSTDYEDRIKSLFDEAGADVPDEAFVSTVMSTIRRRERTARLRAAGYVLGIVAFVALLAPEIQGLVASLNGFIALASEQVPAVSRNVISSPVTWIFAAPLGAYYLLITARRPV